MHRQKSLKQLGGIQLFYNRHFQLNTSTSASVLNKSSFENLPAMQTQKRTSGLNGDRANKRSSFKIQKAKQHKQQTASLLKSKQMSLKFADKLSQLPKRKPQSPQIQHVKYRTCDKSLELGKSIAKKIQNQFTKILNSQSVMPMAEVAARSTQLRQNNIYQNYNSTPNSLSIAQGTKMLMTKYWQKDLPKKSQISELNENQEQDQESSQLSLKPATQVAPTEITPSKTPNIILGRVTQLQKKRQQLLKQKDQELKLGFYTFNVQIQDCKIRNQSKEFLLFQSVNFMRWEDIAFVLQCLQRFCQVYDILQAKINLKRVLQVVETGQKRDKLKQASDFRLITRSSLKGSQKSPKNPSSKTEYSTHQLLSCFQDAQKISETHPNSKGIRFFDHKGKKRAIIKIQSQFRKYMCRKKFQTLKEVLMKVVLIQRKYRSYLQLCRTKQAIFQVQIKKIQKFKQLQQQFRLDYRKNQMTKRQKYQIHICSMSSSQWHRVTTQNLNQRQNTQLSRIFRIATKSSPLMETKVIYIAPNQLPRQIVSYYKKIFQFGSQTQRINDTDKLTILWPQGVEKLPQSLTLTQKLLCSKTVMKKLRRLVRGNYSYIVPSNPHNDFVSLCCELDVPLYAAEPQKLLYLQTKSGSKQFAQVLKQQKQQDSSRVLPALNQPNHRDSSSILPAMKQQQVSFGILPYCKNIYNKTSLVNQLCFLVCNYPSVRRWILKIDNQHNSRGLAYIDTSKILKSQLLDRLIDPKHVNDKLLNGQVYQRLFQTLVTFKEERIIPLLEQVYRCQQEFLSHFLAYGGIIEASINNFQSDLENHCFVVQIQPDFQWKFVTSYYKITNKNRTIGCYYDSSSQMQPPIQIQLLVKELIRKGCFGFFTLEFITIPSSDSHKSTNLESTSTSISRPRQNLTYFNGIQCHLNDLSSASFLKLFLSKDTNVLYIPFLAHPSLKQLRVQTFFHLCRLQNISFDIQRKIGNVFMFLNGLQCGCMGLMSFNKMSKKQTFQQVSDVLQFLDSKLNQSTNQTKNLTKQFMSVRNVVNGYLKKDKNYRLSKQMRHHFSSNNIHRPLSNKQLDGYF